MKNKKIFFYSNHRENDKSIGITKKVHSQIEALRRMGYVVYYSCYCGNGIGIFDNNNDLLVYKKYPINIPEINHVVRRLLILAFCKKFILTHKFEILYMRFHFWDKYSVDLIKTAKQKKLKVIVEAHAYPYYLSHPGKLMKLIYLMDSIYQRKVIEYVDMVAAITDKDDLIWGCKTIKIENGINVTDSECRVATEYNENVLKIVCVANENVSHGIDRLIKGVANYYSNGGKKKILVWLIGEYFNETKKMVQSLNLGESILFEGKKYGDQLYKYYNIADFGVGILAGFRQDYHLGICLKTKEYFAVGLPFITSADSKAEVNRFDFVVVCDESDRPIDISMLLKRKTYLKNRAELAIKMHNYAVEHYSWDDEMNKIFHQL